MAQVNISYFTDSTAAERRQFVLFVRDVVAKEVHGLERSEIQPGSVSVMVVPLDMAASISGADLEVQVLVSGNNWPANRGGKPANAAEAKTHFDAMASRMHNAFSEASPFKVYVWVTPFTASGWAS